jgi:YD repeat-containing protein
MAHKTLKDIFGRIIGSIDDDGKTERAYNEKRQYTGRYDRAFDRTYDKQGRTVGAGNLVTNTIIGKKS